METGVAHHLRNATMMDGVAHNSPSPGTHFPNQPSRSPGYTESNSLTFWWGVTLCPPEMNDTFAGRECGYCYESCKSCSHAGVVVECRDAKPALESIRWEKNGARSGVNTTCKCADVQLYICGELSCYNQTYG